MFINKTKKRGQALVEYALIIASMAVLLISSLGYIGNNVNNSFSRINNSFTLTTP
ncbi:Flp family type IVb pilin [bacterium]|nr:Flp family type IVb pilin [bacterium]